MPECKLGLNDRVLLEAQGTSTKGKSIDLEDMKFHQYASVTLLSILVDTYGQYRVLILIYFLHEWLSIIDVHSHIMRQRLIKVRAFGPI